MVSPICEYSVVLQIRSSIVTILIKNYYHPSLLAFIV